MPAAPKEAKATAPKEHYQLWVATHPTHDEALILKKKIQAVKVPVTVYRGAVDKKLYFAVKAGPYTSKKQARGDGQPPQERGPIWPRPRNW